MAASLTKLVGGIRQSRVDAGSSGVNPSPLRVVVSRRAGARRARSSATLLSMLNPRLISMRLCLQTAKNQSGDAKIELKKWVLGSGCGKRERENIA